jgi:hypothetical protein
MKTQIGVQNGSNNIFKAQVNIENLFELAIDTANQGYPLKAMAIAREALIFAKQENKYICIYIHSFLAVLSMDFQKFSNARIHIYNALNRLESKHFSYNTDKQYLSALLNQLESLDETPNMVQEAMAA